MGARVLLNVDLGELPDEPEALYGLAHVANVACGGHAGDEASMGRAVELCTRHGTLLGAHPSYPDREGFGRRPVTMTTDAIWATVMDQCARLAALARAKGRHVAFMKPHGALYHAAQKDAAAAEALVEATLRALGPGVTVIGPPVGALVEATARATLRFAREGFADRATHENGSLVARGEPGALVVDPVAAAARATALVREGHIETLCVHGDTPGAVAVARAVRRALDAYAAGA
ncbi:MAG TPA: LamB/YcsF family protein [Gemmatimonadales bacterium]|nr:LamB/YcsF family protein [Gemmatimonadales bacterium]